MRTRSAPTPADGIVLIGCDIAQQWDSLRRAIQLWGPVIEFVEAGVLQGELTLSAAEAGAYIDILGCLYEQRNTLDLRDLGPEPIDDLARASIALGARFQIDEDTAVIDGRVDAACSDCGNDPVDSLILQQEKPLGMIT